MMKPRWGIVRQVLLNQPGGDKGGIRAFLPAVRRSTFRLLERTRLAAADTRASTYARQSRSGPCARHPRRQRTHWGNIPFVEHPARFIAFGKTPRDDR